MEKVYERALLIELTEAGLQAVAQHPIQVQYHGRIVGDYVADLVVENQVLIELKANSGLNDAHKAQCLNYLKATGLQTCLLLNFGTDRVQVQRIRR